MAPAIVLGRSRVSQTQRQPGTPSISLGGTAPKPLDRQDARLRAMFVVALRDVSFFAWAFGKARRLIADENYPADAFP